MQKSQQSKSTLNQANKRVPRYSRDNLNSKIPDTSNQPTIQQNKANLMRSDIYLLRVKINQVNFEGNYDKYLSKELQESLFGFESKRDQLQVGLMEQIQAYIDKKQKYGDLDVLTVQKNPFYITEEQYRDKFLHQTHKISWDSKIASNSQIPMINKQKSKSQTIHNEKQLQQQDIISNPGKLKLYKLISTKQETSSRNHHKSQTINTYEQHYKFDYRRQMIQDYKGENQLNINSMFRQKSLIQSNHRHLQTRPHLKDLFCGNDSLMFSVTEDAFLEVKFKEADLNSTVKYLKTEKGQKSICKKSSNDMYFAKFPLKPFLQIPFTNHEIELTLCHQAQNQVQTQQKAFHQQHEINPQISLTIFCVGRDISWGKLNLREIRIDNWQGKHKHVSLHLQFPDVHQCSKIASNNQVSKVQLKVLSLEPQQKPIWTDEIEIMINPRRNKLRIHFVEMDDNKIHVKSTLAQSTIDLLEEGFLFHHVQTFKHVPLKVPFKQLVVDSVGSEKPQKIVDLSIKLCFQISQFRNQIQYMPSHNLAGNFFDTSLNLL